MADHNEVLTRIDNISNKIKEFKFQQEDSILRSKEFTAPRKFRNVITKQQSSEASIAKVLNTECILMPMSIYKNDVQKLWPQALSMNFFILLYFIENIISPYTYTIISLVANYANSSADIGLI